MRQFLLAFLSKLFWIVRTSSCSLTAEPDTLTVIVPGSVAVLMLVPVEPDRA